MKKLILFFALVMSTSLMAQENAKVLVEHFTNTFCGICTGRNPGIIAALEKYKDDVVHITYYPSVPYNQCSIYNYNTAENGEKQSLYSISGTPRVIVNGTQIQSTGQSSVEAAIEAAIAETYPVNVVVDAPDVLSGTTDVSITLSSDGNVMPTDGRLFVAVVEEMYAFDAPNGESEHHNVFRDMITEAGGMAVAVSADAQTMNFSVEVDPTLNASELYIVAFYQDMSDKTVLGSSSSKFKLSTSVNTLDASLLKIYPNPVTDQLQIDLGALTADVTIYDIKGQQVWSAKNASSLQEIQTQLWANGQYSVHIKAAEGTLTKSITVQH